MFEIRRSMVDVRSLSRRRSALRPQTFLILDLMIPTQQILGLRFFHGNVDEAVAFLHRHGGYLVAPSGTCFARLREDEPYRCAMLSADLAIADSGLMVLAWRLLRHEKIQRISGLKYLKQLLARLEREGRARVFWILPGKLQRQNLYVCFDLELLRSRLKTVMSRPGTGWKFTISTFWRGLRKTDR